MNSYKIPAGAQETTLEIKRSHFVTAIDHTKGVDRARAFLASLRVKYPDANHHCYAYIAGAPDDVFQIDQSDDGEPRGTAGKPMLNVLQHSGVGEISVVVVRYFGGVKLGAGGLVRAYTQCVSSAMAELATVDFVRKASLTVTLSYSLLAQVEHWLASTDIDTVNKYFESDVRLDLDVPETAMESTIQTLQEISQGAIVCWIVDDAF